MLIVGGIPKQLLYYNLPYFYSYRKIITLVLGDGIKNKSVEKYLSQNGYMVYADTNINTIFVRRDLWQRSA